VPEHRREGAGALVGHRLEERDMALRPDPRRVETDEHRLDQVTSPLVEVAAREALLALAAESRIAVREHACETAAGVARAGRAIDRGSMPGRLEERRAADDPLARRHTERGMLRNHPDRSSVARVGREPCDLGLVERDGAYPFALIALVTWLPATLVLLARQRRDPAPWRAALGFALSFLVLAWVARYFQTSGLVYPLAGLLVAAQIALAPLLATREDA